MWFQDLKLGRKQSIGFGVILVIMASLNFFSIHRLSVLRGEIDAIAQDRLPSALAIASIDKAVSDLRVLQLQHAFATDDSSRTFLSQVMIELIERIDELRDECEPLMTTEDEQTLYQRFDEKWGDYLELSNEFLMAFVQSPANPPVDLITRQAQPVYTEMSDVLRDLVSVNRAAVNQTAAEAADTHKNTRKILTLLFVVTIILSILISSWLVRWITVPVRELAEASVRVAGGDLDVVVKGHGKDEIGNLASTFNRMTESLQAAQREIDAKQAQLSEANKTLAGKNQDLEEALQQLREAQQQLVMSEKMASLGALVAGVAHEINNPVGAVNSGADTAARSIEVLHRQIEEAPDLESLKSNKRFNTALEILRSNNETTVMASNRITEIVRSLKNFARLDESDFQEADVHEGLDSTLTLLHHDFKKRITVEKDYGTLPRVQCYPNQLNQVLMNVLANAGQSIDGEGTITVRTRHEGDRIVIEISDTGRGIKKENLEHIFDPGFTTKGVGVGTGLGLSISYSIVQKHNGTIKAQSEVGKGTTMRISLPVRQPNTVT